MLEEFITNDYSFEDVTELNDNLQYLDHINLNYEFKLVSVSPGIAYRYQGNFFGLLKELRTITPDLYVYTMYLNGLSNPTDYTGEKLTIKVAIKPPVPKY